MWGRKWKRLERKKRPFKRLNRLLIHFLKLWKNQKDRRRMLGHRRKRNQRRKILKKMTSQKKLKIPNYKMKKLKKKIHESISKTSSNRFTINRSIFWVTNKDLKENNFNLRRRIASRLSKRLRESRKSLC